VPNRDVIDAAFDGLDLSPVGGGGSTGESLADAALLIVHRGENQQRSDRCGIWTVGQRLVGCIESSSYSGSAAGRLTDPDGHVLGEREDFSTRRAHDVPRELWGKPLRDTCWVQAEDRFLATILSSREGAIIECPAPASPWSLKHDRGNGCGIWDGDQALAAGWARAAGWGGRGLTTAITLHRELTLDQRVVVLLATLGWLGPPTIEPD
jgi:hypothetical protein